MMTNHVFNYDAYFHLLFIVCDLKCLSFFSLVARKCGFENDNHRYIRTPERFILHLVSIAAQFSHVSQCGYTMERRKV